MTGPHPHLFRRSIARLITGGDHTRPKEAHMTWRVAYALDVLLNEINAAAPNRSKVSDGSIGDAAHASRTSDHNPWVIKGGVGIVRARDFTHDPNGGLDCNVLAERLAEVLASGTHQAARSGAYVIWNRRIFSFDRRGEGWRPYTGSNPHDHHCHLSVTTDPAGFDSKQLWGVMIAPKPDLTRGPDVDAAIKRVRRARRATKNAGRRSTLKRALDALRALPQWEKRRR